MTNSPCPFCGTDPPDLRVDVEEDAGKYAAEAHCLDCDAVGPETGWCDDPKIAADQAIVLWNRRKKKDESPCLPPGQLAWAAYRHAAEADCINLQAWEVLPHDVQERWNAVAKACRDS